MKGSKINVFFLTYSKKNVILVLFIDRIILIIKKSMAILNTIKIFKNRLTRIGSKEPLNFFSIVLIIGLDLFVLGNLFQGLGLQTEQLEAPWEQIPYKCSDLIDSIDTSEEKKNTVFKVLNSNGNYYTEFENKYSADLVNNTYKENIYTACRDVFDVATALSQNEDLIWSYDEIQKKQATIKIYENKIQQYEKDYDTMLLEEIANQSKEDSIIEGKTDDVKDKITNLENKINTLKLRTSNTEEKIMQTDDVEFFLALLKSKKTEIKQKEKSLNFWYPLKKTSVQFVFLFPLLLFFIYLYRRSLSKNSELLILIFAHLLVVLSIPIVFEVIHLILEIVPFHFLADVLAILEALNLIVIWNYLLIFIGIGVTIALIYFIQKKLFSKERLYLKRIAKEKCYACGAKLSHSDEYCYNCGERQLIECPSCKKLTYKEGGHCINCGVNLKEDSTKK